jgi:hypothetical protein
MNKPQPSRDGHDLDALFALARAGRPDTARAEYGFETRLMARLHARRQPEALSLWAVLTWRMAPFFAACVVALALWNSELTAQTRDAEDLSALQNPEAADIIGGMN